MEILRGTRNQIVKIEEYLSEMRREDPAGLFSKKTRNTRFDLWLRTQSSHSLFDLDLFKAITNSALDNIRIYDPEFELLPLERFYVGQVDATSDTDIGGFHSKYSRGFKYLANFGFAVLLSEHYTSNSKIIALELARSYLHDCIHASTFRTIRLVPHGVSAKFPVYREQYGFNFRKPSGISYSNPHNPEDLPRTINLNLLMDGVTVIMTAIELRPFRNQVEEMGLNDFERDILADINLDIDLLSDSYRGNGFHQQVTIPSERFIHHWGGDVLYNLLVASMLTGKLKSLTTYFSEHANTINAWKALFKSPHY
jgi:hypothetical protein